MNILILCTGNSCRSQMAEGFLRFINPALNVFSAGTKPEKKVNPYSIKVMQEIGINISDAKPENVNKFTGMSFDYVITVCDNAKNDCPVFIGKVRNHLHIGFEDPAAAKGSEEEVLNKYRQIRDRIKKRFTQFYEDNVL